MAWYEDEELWVDFACVMFPERREREAADLVATSPLLKVAAGTRVLDLACGPGVHVVPLARHGAVVTGVDLSDAMLTRARAACARAGVTARLIRADMRDHVEPDTYDLVINMYTSFGYFTDPGDNLTVLRNAYASLTPGGTLLVDVLGKEVFASWVGRPQAVDVATEHGGGTAFMRDTVLDDWTRVRSDWTLVRDSTVRQASISSVLYSAAELRALFEQAGLADVECFGEFDARPYDNNARRLIVRGSRAH
jgi:SAM-dependent methyltransferase